MPPELQRSTFGLTSAQARHRLARPARSRRHAGARAASGALVLLPLLAACRGVAPEPRKYFHRDTSMSALLGFAYAVEVGKWDYAFESLDRGSREAFETRFRFQWGIRLQSDPDFDIPVRDLISEAVRYRSSPRAVSREPPVEEITLFYVAPRCRCSPQKDAPDSPVNSPAMPPSAEGSIPAAVLEQADIILPVFLVREDGAWRIDLISTLGTSYRDQLALR